MPVCNSSALQQLILWMVACLKIPALKEAAFSAVIVVAAVRRAPQLARTLSQGSTGCTSPRCVTTGAHHQRLHLNWAGDIHHSRERDGFAGV